MDNTHLELQIEAALEREGAREGYPEGFPPRLRIPVERYSAPEFGALERERLWSRSWLCAGRDEELPETGSFKRFDRGGSPLVLVRGRDGIIRAFDNICRHRGATLVGDSCGRVARLTCPYHAWSYALSGELLATTERRDFSGLDPAESALTAVRCETWEGWVFVNRDPEAVPLATEMRRIGAEMAVFGMRELRLQGHRVYPVQCNWKATQDAFLESYHVQFIHPTTAGPLVHPQRIALALFAGGHSRMAMGKRTQVDGGTYAGQMPADCDIPSVTDAFRRNFVAWHLFPNIISPADAGGFPFVIFWPTSPTTADIELYLVGRDGEKNAASSAYWQAMLDGLDFIMGEDTQFLAGVQKSLESPAFQAMQIGYQERRIYWTHEEIDRRIGPERIPESMRVEQRLAGFVE